MTAVGILAHAIKATALVVLLSLGWAMPVQAHSGHAKPNAVAPATKVGSQDTRLTSFVSASPAAEVADICTPSTPGCQSRWAIARGLAAPFAAAAARCARPP